MYSQRQLIKGLQNPKAAVHHLLNKTHNLHNYCQRSIFGREGVKVMECDWDNLIILDACRYDLFERYNTINGELVSVISAGSHTLDFLVANFPADQYSDTVYVSTTPQFTNNELDGTFYREYQLWETHWSEELQTVPPETTAEEAKRISETCPNKRLIVHFLQPHYPFIGPTGRQIEHRTVTGGTFIEDDRESVWKLLQKEEIKEELVWKAYIENFELTLPHVETLIEDLQGKTVVTSDHGNVFGSWGMYGHPSKTFIDSLVRVPWLVVKSDNRKKITEGTPKQSNDNDIDGVVESRLTELGYQ